MSKTEKHSKVDNKKLLFSLIRLNNITENRADLSPNEEFLQVCAKKLKKNDIVKAHKHKFNNRNINLTQEAWVVIDGKIKADIYDVDDTYFETIILESGDCIVFFRGGHQLTCLTNDTIFFEFKNGPYLGIFYDKESINN